MINTNYSHHEELAATHYDFYKEVHGIRPRWFDYDSMSIEQLEAELESLSKEAEVVFSAEEKAAEQAVDAFKSRVAQCITLGAKNEEVALRWILDAEGYAEVEFFDIEHFVWNQGILFTDYGKELVVKLRNLLTH